MPMLAVLKIWAEQRPKAVAFTAPGHPSLSYAELLGTFDVTATVSFISVTV